ncbi:MAG: 16S rRNA (guanine(966)-N(2))-methyltransferase RsmD [Clostridia bacterium]
MRIIAGTANGRRFDSPKGMDTRPTLDRVKESMFGMLQFDIPGSDVLDLFSGSGNLGLEAASRGAASVVCNDCARICAEQIRKNAQLLKLDSTVSVMQYDYASCIQRLMEQGKTFDIVFLDAPYADGTAEKAAELLIRCGRLKTEGRIMLEHARKLPPKLDASIAETVQTRNYGICAVTILKGTGKS